MIKEKHLSASTLPKNVIGIVYIANEIGLLKANNVDVFIGLCHGGQQGAIVRMATTMGSAEACILKTQVAISMDLRCSPEKGH
jgi:hypothetical protein